MTHGTSGITQSCAPSIHVLTAKGKRDLSAAYNKCLFAEIIDYLIEPPDAYFKTNPATVPAWVM